jgi:hypothetical protein
VVHDVPALSLFDGQRGGVDIGDDEVLSAVHGVEHDDAIMHVLEQLAKARLLVADFLAQPLDLRDGAPRRIGDEVEKHGELLQVFVARVGGHVKGEVPVDRSAQCIRDRIDVRLQQAKRQVCAGRVGHAAALNFVQRM